MGSYRHFSLNDRKRVTIYLGMGLNVDQIAQKLGRHRSSIYRELNRNHVGGVYKASDAHKQAKGRSRGKVAKLLTIPALFAYVKTGLINGWSPEQISGRLKRENQGYTISHESIYRFIYNYTSTGWYRYLWKPKLKRRHRRKPRTHGKKYARLFPINQRPATINNRTTFGHWEGDLMMFSRERYHNISTLVERKSRFLKILKNDDRKSKTVMNNISMKLSQTPKTLFQSMTFDQGSEFAFYHPLLRYNQCRVYYCQPSSPWQKGTNENTNGRIRRWLPRKIKIRDISQDTLDAIADLLNRTPRKCLQYQPPLEVAQQELSKLRGKEYLCV